MGKIRRERQKFHISSANDGDDEILDVAEPPKLLSIKPISDFDKSANIFAGVNIKLDSVNKFEQPSAAKPQKKSTEVKPKVDPNVAETSKAISVPQSDKHLTKKEKMKLKHEKLLEKIDVVRQAMNKKKKSKKLTSDKASTTKFYPWAPKFDPAEGSIDTMDSAKKELIKLNDSLPSLDSVVQFKSKDIKTGLEYSKSKHNKNQSNEQATTRKAIQKIGRNRKQFAKSYKNLQSLFKSAKSQMK